MYTNEDFNTKSKKPIYKKWWFITIIILIIIAFIVGIVFLTINITKQQVTNNSSSSVNDTNKNSKIKRAKTVEELEDIINTDVESSINLLSNQWTKLKGEINTYEKYLDNVKGVEEYYETINTKIKQLSNRFYAYSDNCADIVISSKEDDETKCDNLEMIDNVIYEDACKKIDDGIYDGILKDMEDTFYGGIIKNAEKTVSSTSEWYDVQNDAYEAVSEARSDVYDSYSDARSDIYDFYSDLNSAVYDGNEEKIDKILKEFQEKVDELADKSGETVTEKVEKIGDYTNTAKGNEVTKSEVNATNNNEVTETEINSTNNGGGITPEFKQAMDTYEATMNEYVEFMKKYKANPTDTTLVSQYSNITKKYAEQIKAFEQWNSKELSKEETEYYIDVQSRVSQKLLEVTTN